MSELSDEQRAQLVGPDARMEGYYIDFEKTGVDVVDQILSAVAWAGKGAHGTDAWTDELDHGYGPVPKGGTLQGLIQDAANDAAARLSASAPVPSSDDVREALEALVDSRWPAIKPRVERSYPMRGDDPSVDERDDERSVLDEFIDMLIDAGYTPSHSGLGVTPEEAWQDGVDTALNYAIRNPDGITLRLEHLDGRPWVNPHGTPGSVEAVDERRRLAALARERVDEDFRVIKHGEIGEPSNGALLLRLADAVSATPTVIEDGDLLDGLPEGTALIDAKGHLIEVTESPRDDGYVIRRFEGAYVSLTRDDVPLPAVIIATPEQRRPA